MALLRVACLLLCALLFPALSAYAQDSVSLYGNVKGDDHASSDAVPRDWPVSITVSRAGDNGAGKTKRSKGSPYSVTAPNNSTVNLTFWSKGYDDFTVERIATENSAYRVPPVPVNLSRIITDEKTLMGPSVRVRLQRAKKAADITGEVDILLYNIEVYRKVFSEKADESRVIDQFEFQLRADPDFRRELTPEREKNWLLYKQMLKSDGVSEADREHADPAAILRLVKDETVFPGIRDEVIDKFTQTLGAPAVKQEALDYFRSQSGNESSELFSSSLLALARLGTAADRSFILSKLVSGDYESKFASIRAVKDGPIAEGFSTLANLVMSDADTSIKEYAAQSLLDIARRSDPTSNAAIKEIDRVNNSPRNKGAIKLLDAQRSRTNQGGASSRP